MSPGTYRPLRALGFLLAAQASFALLDTAGKALAATMGVPLISLARHAGHALLMVVLLATTVGLGQLVRTRRPWLQGVRGLVLTGFTLSFFSGLRYLPLAEATAINFVAPFVVMLAAGPILSERVTWPRWVGAAIGFVGMLLIVRPGTELHPLGVALILVTVACNIVFQLATRVLAASENSLTTVFLSALIGIAVSAATLPLQDAWGGWPKGLESRELLLLASLGVTGAISQWCLVRAYYWSNASFVAPLVFLQIIWSTLSGWAFFGQFPDALALAGMGIICAAGIGATLGDGALRRRPASS
jgi:drug/metabolite transporter (DMT)-like permease